MVRGSEETRILSRHQSNHQYHARLARREEAAPGLGRLAYDLAADAAAIYAFRGTLKQGGARTWFCGYRRNVALEIRHAAGCVQQRSRPPLGSGPASLFEIACLCAHEVAPEVR